VNRPLPVGAWTARWLLWGLVAWLLAACATAFPPDAATPAASLASPEATLAMREHPERLIVLAVANPQDSGFTLPGSVGVPYAASSRYAAGGSARLLVQAVSQQHGLSPIAAWPIAGLRLHCVVVEIAAGASRERVLAALAQDRRVELAQPLQSFATLAAAYNDPYVDLQRGFVAIDAAGAQQRSRGKGVRIAVIDTGIDTGHPDLQGVVSSSRNFVDHDSQDFVHDRHGTEVAGIIAAVANNQQGIVGVAPEARLLAFKACWYGRAGDAAAQCNSYTLAQALMAAIDSGAQIINLSLGGPADELLTRLVALALRQGRIVVGAVSPQGGLGGFPVGVPGVIAVDSAGSAVPAKGVLTAPGRDILTLLPGAAYDFASGSSLATAHVSAAAALLLAAQPGLNAAAVQAALQASMGLSAGPDERAGINVCRALQALRAAPAGGACADPGTPTIPAHGQPLHRPAAARGDRPLRPAGQPRAERGAGGDRAAQGPPRACAAG